MIPLKSRETIKVLNYYFLNPTASHYVNELARILNSDPKNLHRKLNELEKEGLLTSEFIGKQRYFILNKRSKIAKTYRDLLAHTVGLEGQLGKVVGQVSGVEHAYIYGSYAKNAMTAGSDVDLLVIGSHSALALQKVINRIQKWSGREINAVNLSGAELLAKKRSKNPFIMNIFAGKNIKLL